MSTERGNSIDEVIWLGWVNEPPPWLRSTKTESLPGALTARSFRLFPFRSAAASENGPVMEVQITSSGPNVPPRFSNQATLLSPPDTETTSSSPSWSTSATSTDQA